MPVSSGGANPVRAVLLDGSTFLYVLNRGTSANPAGTSICTTDHPCSNYNITQFSVGANGSLTAQQVYCAIQTGGCTKPILQGINPYPPDRRQHGNPPLRAGPRFRWGGRQDPGDRRQSELLTAPWP
jgi:hypothetical protein